MQITEMTEKYAMEISEWKYADEFHIYNMPSWKEMVEDEWALTDVSKRKSDYFAFVTEDKGLVAFTRHTMQADGIMLGVGVNPKYLSLGYGSEAIKLTVEYLMVLYPSEKIFLDVRTWNKRAVRSYEKAGFIIEKTLEQETHVGNGQFFRMYYER